MTTYLGDKAVGIGTVKAEIGVTGIVLHDETLVGNGNTEPLGVNTANIVSQQTLANTVSVLNTAIDAQADAIAKTRKDMNEKDSELESILNEHADELTTLRGNQASLGDQVSNIESKIPESASETNPLITKQQLLDEEMDIRSDYNELVSELQTQITAQAGAIAGLESDKLDRNLDPLNAGKYLIVGDDGNVGLTTSGGGGSSLPDQTGNAGKFLTTDGTEASWSDKPLVNTAEGVASICVGGNGAQTKGLFATAVGTNSFCDVNGGFGVAIGYSANVRGNRAIQIGNGENRDANTLKVSNANGNFEMMSADGTIPLERLTKVTDQIGDISTALTAILGE